jgi:2-desacetyl-2-hydroxyethyl bacteriochlorophyllide A dehydrogenase
VKSIRILAPGSIELQEGPRLEPGSGEVIVKVAYSGICGSDVELRAGNRPAPFVRYPVVPGHEWSGIVVRVGKGADPELCNRKVVGEGFLSCGTCRACQRGLRMLCSKGYDEIGFTRDGAWSEELRLPAELIHLLSDEADLRAAAGLEPAACAMEAVRLARLDATDRVAVVGSGNIGLLVIQLARAVVVGGLTAVDPMAGRALLAMAFGANEFLHPEEIETQREKFDVVFEAAGGGNAAQSSVDLVRPGGKVVLVGLPSREDRILVSDLVSKRVELLTVFGATRDSWNASVKAFSAGILDPGKLVSHEFSLSDVENALDLLESGASGTTKVLLRP